MLKLTKLVTPMYEGQETSRLPAKQIIGVPLFGRVAQMLEQSPYKRHYEG